MIPYSEIFSAEKVKPEAMYSWQDPDTGVTRMWAIDRLCEWLPTSGIEIKMAAMDEKRAEYFLENRGIEMDRLQWLASRPEEAFKPAILVRVKCEPSEEFPEGFWDLTLDGHHRYVVLAAAEVPAFRFYHLTEEEASQFEVSDVPQTSREEFEDFVRNSHSRLELTRRG